MAKPDDDPRAPRDALRREEGALAAFFEAGRAERRTPPTALLDAILADAAAARSARAARTAAGVRRRAPRAWPDVGALMRPLGGWGAAAALAGCLAAGFLAGSLGAGADLAAGAIWSDSGSIETAADGVDGFFDLDATEG